MLRFVLDEMLGRLSRWLRVLGHDAVYRAHYQPNEIEQLVKGGRRLITRNRELAEQYPESIRIVGNRVGDQLTELKEKDLPVTDPAHWFSRCLVCNVSLETASDEEAGENVPEYIYYENKGKIRKCASCGRFYWPGSHRTRMIGQLRNWGIIPQP